MKGVRNLANWEERIMRTALQVNAAYAVVVGVLLLVPNWASIVFARPITDVAVTSGWGTSVIVLGLLSYVASTDLMKHGSLAGVFVLGLLLTALDLAYFWAQGDYTARTILVPVIINVVLAVWIWTARGKTSPA
jgi:hypothetical protein